LAGHGASNKTPRVPFVVITLKLKAKPLLGALSIMSCYDQVWTSFHLYMSFHFLTQEEGKKMDRSHLHESHTSSTRSLGHSGDFTLMNVEGNG
jgi:hypothetical protein